MDFLFTDQIILFSVIFLTIIFFSLEILPLDPLSAEAWDWPKTQAGPQYEGILRFNVVGISKNIGNLEYENFTYYDGQDVTLTNDVYGAHTQPSGLYH